MTNLDKLREYLRPDPKLLKALEHDIAMGYTHGDGWEFEEWGGTFFYNLIDEILYWHACEHEGSGTLWENVAFQGPPTLPDHMIIDDLGIMHDTRRIPNEHD